MIKFHFAVSDIHAEYILRLFDRDICSILNRKLEFIVQKGLSKEGKDKRAVSEYQSKIDWCNNQKRYIEELQTQVAKSTQKNMDSLVEFNFVVDDGDAEYISGLFQDEICRILDSRRKFLLESNGNENTAKIKWFDSHIEYIKQLKTKVSKSTRKVEQ